MAVCTKHYCYFCYPGEKLRYFGATRCHGDNCNYLQINHYCTALVIIHWLFLDRDVKLSLSWHVTYSDFLLPFAKPKLGVASMWCIRPVGHKFDTSVLDTANAKPKWNSLVRLAIVLYTRSGHNCTFVLLLFSLQGKQSAKFQWINTWKKLRSWLCWKSEVRTRHSRSSVYRYFWKKAWVLLHSNGCQTKNVRCCACSTSALWLSTKESEMICRDEKTSMNQYQAWMKQLPNLWIPVIFNEQNTTFF